MTTELETPRLRLVLDSTQAVLDRIAALSDSDRAHVSPIWLERMRNSPPSPWTHGFAMVERASGVTVGSCGFRGPPDADGIVEIAYGVHEVQRGRGFAREAAAALVDFALGAGARVVCAHTLPEPNTSTRVLEACGFIRTGEVVDPEDGLVWRWEFVPGAST